MATSEEFGAAVDAYAKKDCDVGLTRDAIRALTPPGIVIRPHWRGAHVDVEIEGGDGASVAMLYLRQYRSRVRDPKLTAYAWAAINAIAGEV